MNLANGANGLPLNMPQVQTPRSHVPSQAERTKSLELIRQWKVHVESMKLSIHDAEGRLHVGYKSLDNAYEAKVAAIRRELVTAKSRLNVQARAHTELLRIRLAATERKLFLEEVFVAGIRRIPDQILLEIFEWCLDGGFPTRGLAFVCKAWKVLLQRTPSFWSNLTAFFVDPQTAVRQARILRRRIKLSRSTLLDVTLSTLGYDGLDEEANRLDLFTLVIRAGIDRWRSLKIVHDQYWEDSYITLELALEEKFSSLRNIEFDILTGGDPFLPFYTILQDSNAPISEVICLNGVPQLLRGSPIFQHASKIVTKEQFIGHFPPLDNLQEMIIQNRVSRQKLDSLQKNNLVHLEIQGLSDLEPALDLAFPELLSLSITNDDELSSVQNITAPKLTKLELGTHFSPLDKKKHYSMTLGVIRYEIESITFKPTTLHIDIGLSTKGLLIVLKEWAQLMYLSIAFGEEFLWSGDFIRALYRKSNPLCPKLVTLRLRSRSADFGENMKQWEASAMGIFAARKNMPLKVIEWRQNDGPWYRLTPNGIV